MKFALVVASGVHTGKEIAVPGPSLVIGRADGCHLRPASPAISNKHCEVFVRDAAVFVRDLGSTNGTLLNDRPVTGDAPVKAGDRLKVGPLDFTVKLTPAKSDSTPLPEALKSVGKSASTGASKPVPKPAAAATKPAPVAPKPAPAAKGASEDDAMAAMLLGMDDDDPVEVPGGSTVMEMPAIDAAAAAAAAKSAADKKIPSQADSSSAAKDLLNRYTQRPRR